MNTKIIISVIVLILIFSGYFLLQQKDVPRQLGDNVNEIFRLKFQDYDGDSVSLADFQGRPLVINSWAAWCPFCRKELVDFAVAQKEFGNQVVIIAIDRAEPLETAKKYSDELGVANGLVLLLDPADSFYQSIGGFSMPETIFVDAGGNVKIHKRGPMDFNEIREKIQQLLQN